MTHPTNEELDALVERMDNLFAMLEEEGFYTKANTAAFARKAIAAMRAQITELREGAAALASWQCEFTDGETGLVCDEYGNQFCAMKVRADRAEAALAAQIQADAGLMERRADDLSDAVKWGGSKQYITSLKGGEVELRNAAKLIRNQPHDRTALDRLLADAEAKALRRAAKACDWGDIYGDNAVKCILAMIPKEGEA